MKKVLSLTLALLMLLTSVSAAFTVQAREATKIEQVERQIQRAADYVIGNTDMNTISYPDYWTLLKSGADMTAYRENCLASLKTNLEKNDGKIVIEGTEWYQDENKEWQSYSYSYEDLAVYGAAILITGYYGYDTTDFEGYDLTAPLKNFDLSTVTNPYAFRTAIEAALSEDWFNDKEYADELAMYLISNFYDMGKGLNYYGYSCDNTGHFLAALGGLEGQYDLYVNDALAVIKQYTKENGAYADSVYVTDVNADSTALAMMGYAAAKNYDGACWYYNMLIDQFYNAQTGAFQTANYTTGALEDNLYATKDALLALEYYKNNITTCHSWDGAVVKEATCTRAGEMLYVCRACGKTKRALIAPAHHPAAAVKENDVKATVAKGGSYDLVVYCADCKEELSRKKVKTAKLKVGATAITKLTTGKRSFTATWKKQTKNTTGYQIQYSTNKNFKKGNKTVTVKSNKTVKKTVKNLKAKKTYYVRIRAYKTVNGKKYYSAWSKAKSVKTK